MNILFCFHLIYKETTNAPVTQSASHQPHTHECDKLTIIDAVARNSYVYNPDGSVCKDGKRHNNDALVMTLCKAPGPSKWIEGEQVYYTENCIAVPAPICILLFVWYPA